MASHIPDDESDGSKPAAPSSAGSAVYLDSVTVKLTTGTDLVARPYGNSVGGRHMMLSQAGTLWKATRSAREKRFYVRMVGASTQRWDWLAREEARMEEQRAREEGDASGKDCEGAQPPPSLPLAPPRTKTVEERAAYAAAANALLPFLPRYYGTRNVAALKVGSVAFANDAEIRERGAGSGPSSPASPDEPMAAPRARFPRSTSSEDAADKQSLANASFVMVKTDAVKQVIAQFAEDKKASMGPSQLHGHPRAANLQKSNGGTSPEGLLETPPALTEPTPCVLPTAQECAPAEGGECRGPSSVNGDVVAVATAQIAEELNRRLPPRHASSLTSSSVTAACGGTTSAAAPASLPRTVALATSFCTPGDRGSSQDPAPGSWVEMIVLEDLCYQFAHPCVMDVKMGTRQYGLDASAEKIAEKEHKAVISTSATHGVRIAGFKRWSPSRQVAEVKSKKELFTLSLDDVRATLLYFLSSVQLENPGASRDASGVVEDGGERPDGNDVPPQQQQQELLSVKESTERAVRMRLVDQLARLRDAFQAHGLFRFYTSSLLIVYDSANPVRTCRIVMVDFAYAYELEELRAAGDADGQLPVDQGYITGIESLIELLRVPQEAAQERRHV